MILYREFLPAGIVWTFDARRTGKLILKTTVVARKDKLVNFFRQIF
jgi:hypothetical protein